jgi:hypothetical protein
MRDFIASRYVCEDTKKNKYQNNFITYINWLTDYAFGLESKSSSIQTDNIQNSGKINICLNKLNVLTRTRRDKIWHLVG